MKEYVPHFNEPLSLPPELSWNLKLMVSFLKIKLD
jgi:hypothetical protein